MNARSTYLDKQTPLDRARGFLPGQSSIKKFGENPTLTSGVTETIWDATGTYVAPTQPRLHNVVSSSTADDGTLITSGTADDGCDDTCLIDAAGLFQTNNVAIGDWCLNDTNMTLGVVSSIPSETEIRFDSILGAPGKMRRPDNGLDGTANATGDSYRIARDASTGAGVFWIQGLDEVYLEQEEFVILNGQSIVATLKTWARQHRARIFSSLQQFAVGTITSTAQTDGTVTCQVIDGNNQTLMAVYTIPADKNAYLNHWDVKITGSVSGSAIGAVRVGTLNGVGYIIDRFAVNTNGTSSVSESDDEYDILPGGSDIWMEATAGTPNLSMAARFTVILIDK